MAEHPIPPSRLTTRETLPYTRYATTDAGAAFLRRAGLHPIHRGRALLWDREEVLAAITKLGQNPGAETQP